MKKIRLLPGMTSFILLMIIPTFSAKSQVIVLDAVDYKQITNFVEDQYINAMKVSGDGFKIVYATGGPFNKVFTMNSDGSGLKEIYDFQRTGFGPSVDISANGNKVIWCDGFGEIFISNPDGSVREELATLLPNPDTNFGDLEPVIPVPPRISANGTQVFFLNMDRDPRVSGLWRVNSDGSGLTQIFNYLKVSEDVFGRDGSEYSFNVAFTDGFDISGDGSVVIFGTRIFKLEEGDLDRGDAIVADGTEFYRAGDYNIGNQPFATNPNGNQFLLYRREFNEDKGFDEINIYFVPIGTGDPVLVAGGLDIFAASAYTQMAADGSRAITHAANGRMPISLVDRASSSHFDLVSIDAISNAIDGFRFSESRLPTINWNGNRFWFLASSSPPQIWAASINSDAVASQPSISNVQIDPYSSRIDGSTTSTIMAHVSHLSDTIHTVSFDAFMDGNFQFRAIRSDAPYNGLLLDNGTFGDQYAGDGFFTNNSVRVDLPETPLGIYTIRIAAVEATLKEATMVDVEPFSIIEANPTSTKYDQPAIAFALFPNYPNPARDASTINYSIPLESYVEIKITDMMGREVLVLVSGLHEPGHYSVTFSADQLPGGLYLYTMRAKDFVKTMRMQVCK